MIFFPPHLSMKLPTATGFRFGHKGTHSSRTLMLADLTAVLDSSTFTSDRAGYEAAIVDGNCLGKPTISTRRTSNQRLGELYSLDPSCTVFRVLRRLWDVDKPSRPLLAMQAALARDPLFMASAAAVLALDPGDDLPRAPLKAALREAVGERMNDAVLEKVLRNTASSWTQTGHLQGRTFKVRQRVEPTPVAVAYGLLLSHTVGFRGHELLSNGWIESLDCSASAAHAMAVEAKRIGLLDLRTAGGVFELSLERLDPWLAGR